MMSQELTKSLRDFVVPGKLEQKSGRCSAKAVVLGLGINGLALVRSLAAGHITVVGVYTSDLEFGKHSRFCIPLRFPNIEDNEKTFTDLLIRELGDRSDRPVLMAESDAYVLFLSRNRETLEKYFRFLVPERPLLERVVQKNTAVLLAAEKGLRIPETFCFEGEKDIEHVASRISYPCVVKPVACYVEIGAKNMVFEDRLRLESFLRGHLSLIDKLIVQAVIPGGDPNTYQSVTYVTSDGLVLPAFTMRKIRQYKPDFGITSFGVGTSVPVVADETRRFLSNCRYRGLASIEFKQHPDDKQFYFIELNPRMPVYHSLLLASGVNYPLYYYQDMIGNRISVHSVPRQKESVHWLCFDKDFGSFAIKYSRRQIRLLPWLLSLFYARVFAFWRSDDPAPFCFSMGRFIIQKSKFLWELVMPKGKGVAKEGDTPA